jgi:hypothetical protein
MFLQFNRLAYEKWLSLLKLLFPLTKLTNGIFIAADSQSRSTIAGQTDPMASHVARPGGPLHPPRQKSRGVSLSVAARQPSVRTNGFPTEVSDLSNDLLTCQASWVWSTGLITNKTGTAPVFIQLALFVESWCLASKVQETTRHTSQSAVAEGNPSFLR